MYVIDKRSGAICDVDFSKLDYIELDLFVKDDFIFDWNEEVSFEVYRLTLAQNGKTLGLISIEMMESEYRIHIRLLSASSDNIGRNKEYDRIVGCMISQVGMIAIQKFGELACVSLRPKSVLTKHYIQKYGMKITGQLLSIEVPELIDLINEYE
jgi:hypothetical protein